MVTDGKNKDPAPESREGVGINKYINHKQRACENARTHTCTHTHKICINTYSSTYNYLYIYSGIIIIKKTTFIEHSETAVNDTDGSRHSPGSSDSAHLALAPPPGPPAARSPAPRSTSCRKPRPLPSWRSRRRRSRTPLLRTLSSQATRGSCGAGRGFRSRPPPRSLTPAGGGSGRIPVEELGPEHRDQDPWEAGPPSLSP